MRKIKRKNKNKILIPLGLLSILLIILLLIFCPRIIEKNNINKLTNEINMVDKYLTSNKDDYKSITNYLKKDLTTGKTKQVEKSLEKYLTNIIKIKKNTLDITNNKELKEIISISNIEKEKNEFKNTLEYLKNTKEDLTKIKDSIKDIDKKKHLPKDKYSKNLYNKLLKNKIKIEELENTISNNIDNIDNINKVIDILKNNKDNYKIENKKIIIGKRKLYDELKTTIEKIKDIKYPEYELPEDKDGPIIEASDITIYKGNNINLKEKIKCTDEIDGEVECSITGDYDINKVGTYSINITAEDTSKNKREKKINIIVKEKVENKAPYYTEVIRNQNTVIVYGLDNNNEYTKIVRVMPCSVGRSGQDTPTGTFKTSDKYRWGALYGGVYGQYATRIVSDILFHSVPYYSQNPGNIEWEEYNKLGSPASLGCVRMTVRDVKWIYDNCPKGMTVKIYDGNLPNGVSKPSAPKIDGSSPNKGWDPTDPDSNNPWNR